MFYYSRLPELFPILDYKDLTHVLIECCVMDDYEGKGKRDKNFTSCQLEDGLLIALRNSIDFKTGDFFLFIRCHQN